MFNVFQDTPAIMDTVFQLTHAQMSNATGDSGANSDNVLLNHNAIWILTVQEVKFVNSEDVLINVLWLNVHKDMYAKQENVSNNTIALETNVMLILIAVSVSVVLPDHVLITVNQFHAQLHKLVGLDNA